MRTVLLGLILLSPLLTGAQTGDINVPPPTGPERDIRPALIEKLGDHYQQLSGSVETGSRKALLALQKQEQQLSRQVARMDSAAAALIVAGQQQYQVLLQRLSMPIPPSSTYRLKDYLPGMDSVQVALGFLQSSSQSLLSNKQLMALGSTARQLSDLQARLQQANDISTFVQQRQQHLQSLLSRYDLSSRLAAFQRRAFYYRAQVQQYKQLLHDPDALAAKVMNLVRQQAAFTSYFRRNSYLSTLFALPADGPDTAKPAPGLQTRTQVAALVAERLGAHATIPQPLAGNGSGSNGGPMGAGLAQGQDQLDKLKGRISQLGGSSSTEPMADFQPNTQHNKTFIQRLQAGFDIQTQQSANYLPAISTIGLSLAYKVDDRHLVGIGIGYLMGWGQPFNHIAISSQGAQLRSFADWKIHGNLWLAGGFEANYYSGFTGLSVLRHPDNWQRSALVGLMKTFTAGKQQGQVQLLFDALYQDHLPSSRPLVFRFGYAFK